MDFDFLLDFDLDLSDALAVAGTVEGGGADEVFVVVVDFFLVASTSFRMARVLSCRFLFCRLVKGALEENNSMYRASVGEGGDWAAEAASDSVLVADCCLDGDSCLLALVATGGVGGGDGTGDFGRNDPFKRGILKPFFGFTTAGLGGTFTSRLSSLFRLVALFEAGGATTVSSTEGVRLVHIR